MQKKTTTIQNGSNEIEVQIIQDGSVQIEVVEDINGEYCVRFHMPIEQKQFHNLGIKTFYHILKSRAIEKLGYWSSFSADSVFVDLTSNAPQWVKDIAKHGFVL